MPVARFQLPDGKVARFEVPEGTTPEQAQAMIEREFPNLIAPRRSTMQEIGRQVGLTARYGIEGLAAIPAALGNVAGTAYNKVADYLQPQTLSGLVTGERGMRFPEQGQAVSNLLTRLGLPQPEGAQERVVGDITRAMAGQGGTVALGRGLATSAGPVAQTVGNLLQARPGAQVVGAVGASGAAGTTREAGGGPVAQTVAGVMGGLAVPVALDITGKGIMAAGRGVRAAARPFTESGREVVVGDTLRRLATHPDTVAARLGEAAEIIPGSTPTTAQAARDPGLLTAERAIRSGPTGGQFAAQQSKANQARNLLLNSMAGDDATIEAAKAARTAATKPLREAALSDANIVGVSTEKLVRQLRGVESQPGIRASDVISKALTEVKEKVTRLTNEEGFINAKDLYTIRKELGNVIRKNAQETQNWDKRLTGGLQDQVQGYIDDAIEAAGGKGWKEYLATYAELSKPIEQAKVLQGVRERVLNPGTDVQTGERIMSAAKFYGAVTKNEAELAKVLTPKQMTNLRAIAQDLDRGALSESAARAAGSNTFQNVSTAYVLGQSLGGKASSSPVLQNMLRPLAWLNKLNEPQLQQLLTDAMLDPALARSLMGRASPRSVESVGLELRQRLAAFGTGAAVGTAITSGAGRQ